MTQPTRIDPPDEQEMSSENVVAVLSGARRVGDWMPPENLRAIAVLGNVRIDLRHADLPPGVTRIEAWALLGSVEILVPGHVEVDVNGSALLGSIEHTSKSTGSVRRILDGVLGRSAYDDDLGNAEDPDEEPPLIEVVGQAFLGSVFVKVHG